MTIQKTGIMKCLYLICGIFESIYKLFGRFSLLVFLLIFIFISISLPIVVIAQGHNKTVDVSEALGDRYYDAVEYLEKNTWIYDTLIKANISPELAYSVVFPSLTRYSALKDIMETSAMKTLYVQSGRKYAKYEIGRFQIRPSFAELVERSATKYKLTDYKFKTTNNPKARSERAKRIDTPAWQVQYLILYVKIMDKRFSHLKWKNPQDKVRFYATAFNIGFNRNERAIRYFMSKRSLMRSSKDMKSKLKHGDIAAWFFENDGYKFKSDIAIIPKTQEETNQEGTSKEK